VEPEGGARERETVERLLTDEIAKVAESKPATRGDFLGRYARIIQHYDLVKTAPEPARKSGTEPAADIGLKPRSKTLPVTQSPAKREFSPSLAGQKQVVPLTTGGAARAEEEATIGFAELLFKNAGGEPSPPDAPDWARAAASAPPTSAEYLMPREDVPMWLKAAVFLGGSMVIGAMCAHLSGSALWQKKRLSVPVEIKSTVGIATPAKLPETSVPKAIPVTEPPPVVIAPPENVPPSRGVTLSLPPGTGGLREQLAPETNPPKPPP